MELITTHIGADFDALASSLIARKLYPEAELFFPGSREESVRRMLDSGFVDSFRHLHPGLAGAYSWWSYRGGARGRNVGWRIDYCGVSDDLSASIVDAAISPEILGSDHCPVSLTLR